METTDITGPMSTAGTMGTMNTMKTKGEEGRQGTGLIHIYCGEGKGKTTAAIGLCIRAAGCGYRILIDQYMKDAGSAERSVLQKIPGITVLEVPSKVKFSFQMSEEEKAAAKTENTARLSAAKEAAASGAYDVLLLDEVIYAVNAGLLDEELLLRFLKEKPADLEVILTGQQPGQALLSLADYVSGIHKIKHPYDQGVKARKGIEY